MDEDQSNSEVELYTCSGAQWQVGSTDQILFARELNTSGFEKLLRRTKRTITHEKDEESSASKKDDDKESKKKDDEKAAN